MAVGHLYIGIDIGGTNLRLALVNGEGAIIRRYKDNSGIEAGRRDFCDRLLAGIDEMRSSAASLGANVAGIGVGVPGLIDSAGFIHSSVNMRPLDSFNMSAFLEDRTGVPSFCGNDANIIALGERFFGAGRCFSSFMAITIGTGLGSGLILDGRLWTGTSGFAAEFGHVTMEPDGPPCPCGNRGCLEQYVSAGALVRFAREFMPPDVLMSLGNDIGAQVIAEIARQGEAGALAAFERMGSWLGIALASLVNTLNLEAVIIGGGVAGSLDLLLPSLAVELDRRSFPQIGAVCKVVKAELGDDAGLLGGAALAFSCTTRL